MKEPVYWDNRPILDSPPENAWLRGCFHTSHENWDGRWLRDLDELRRRDLALFALGDVRGKTVLDVACGSGLYMVVLGFMGASVAGQDLSSSAIAEAREALTRYGLSGKLQTGDAAQLLFQSSTFDAVFSADFVEHISFDLKRAFLKEVFRVLKPGGVLVVKTPNLHYLKASTWLKRAAAVLRGRSPLGIHIQHTRDNPDNEHHGLTTHAELRELVLSSMFHSPSFVRQPFSRKPLPRALQEWPAAAPFLWRVFSRDLILAARKPIFLGYFP